jgi:hypothetical protein
LELGEPTPAGPEGSVIVAKSSNAEAATAYHEAGHAVVGFWEGVVNRLLAVSIVKNDEQGTLGHVRRGKYPRVRDVEPGDDGKPRVFYREFDPTIDEQRLSERLLKPRILEGFAGVLAEKRLTGRRHNWVGALHDLEMTADLIMRLTGSERQAQKYSDYLWVVAEDAVALHWPEIGALAEELLVRKSMTGRETTVFLQTWVPRGR